jgi:hypothetical protein
MVRIGRCASAEHAWLRGHEFAVILVAQANGLDRHVAAAGDRFLRENFSCCLMPSCITTSTNSWMQYHTRLNVLLLVQHLESLPIWIQIEKAKRLALSRSAQ